MGWSLALVLGASVIAAQVLPLKPLRQAEGILEQIDLGSGVLRVKSNGQVIKLQITRATTVFVKGHTGSIDELKVGDAVRGAYEGSGSSGTLQWLEVTE